jgi:uridine phosphorylase
MSYILHLQRKGIINMEMESLAFAAMCNHAGIRAAVVCVSIVDRMQGDQVIFNLSACKYLHYLHNFCFLKVLAQKEVLNEWQLRPQKLVARYIKKHLGILDEKTPIPLHRLCDLSPTLSCPHKHLAVKSPRRMKVVQVRVKI